MDLEYITRVKDRRKYLEADEDNWACERCGHASEEGLAVVQTARCTRSYPNKERCFLLCGYCIDNQGLGMGKEGGRVALYGRVLNS